MKSLLIFLMAVLIFSCNQEQEKEHIDQNVKKTSDESLDRNLFAIKDSDSLLLFFLSKKSFDTTWNLILKKSKSQNIEGYYSQILPQFHKNSNDFLDDSLKLLYKEEFTFEIRNSEWDQILQKMKLKTYKFSDTSRSTCMHCPYYELIWNNININSNVQNQPFLDSSRTILKEMIIDKINFIKKSRLANYK